MRKAFVKGSELTAKSIGTKAAISIGYQEISENKINLITVLANSLLVPWVGEFVGNTFSVEISYDRRTKSINNDITTIFNENMTEKDFVSFIIKSSIKAVLNKNLKAGKWIKDSKGNYAKFGYNVGLHFSIVELDKMIQQ